MWKVHPGNIYRSSFRVLVKSRNTEIQIGQRILELENNLDRKKDQNPPQGFCETKGKSKFYYLTVFKYIRENFQENVRSFVFFSLPSFSILLYVDSTRED